MTITSLSLAFVQFGSTATTAPKPAAPAPVPAPAPAAPACEHHGCDSARRSPLFRALMEVLGSMVQQAPPPAAAAGTPSSAATPAAPAPAPAATTSPTAATSSSATAASTEQPTAAADTAAAAPSTEQPVDLDEAVLNFARALMQALRGRHDDGGSEGEGHGHHHGHRHHDRARMGWGDPAQRVEQLGAQLSAPAPAMTTDTCAPGMTNDTGAPAMATNTSAAAPARAAAAAADIEPAANTAPSDTVLDPVRAVDVAAGRSQATMIYVKFSTDSSAAGAPRLSRTQQGLLDAFGTLQQAMGSTHNDPAASLKAQLSAFLQNLAEKLRAGDVDAAGNTQPGNLLHVMA